jgi:RNA polymerase sigma-70 factor, ECF subfamily
MDSQPLPDTEVTILMSAAAGGDVNARDLLFPLVYDQLRKAAQLQMATERPDHTLSATALVHEAFVKLAGPRRIPWANRAHFYAAAAQAMRRVLIDQARTRASKVRNVKEARQAAINLTSLPNLDSEQESAGFLLLEEALTRLEKADEEAAAVVRLRYFAGLTVEQTAAALGASEPTVKRSWAFARAWLKEAIEAGRV